MCALGGHAPNSMRALEIPRRLSGSGFRLTQRVKELECYRSAYQNAKAKSGWEKYDHTTADVAEAAIDLSKGLNPFFGIHG